MRRLGAVRLTALIGLALAVGVVAFLAAEQDPQGATSVQSPLLGQPAPKVVEPVLYPQAIAGARLGIAGLRGRVVVLSFFASWCAPCQSEAFDLEGFAWHEHVTRAKTTVLGVLFDDQDAAGVQFARDYGFTFPVVEDPGGTLANLFDVTSPPVTVVLSPDQKVSAVLEGAVTASQLARVVVEARSA